jgi:hypothetical protein
VAEPEIVAGRVFITPIADELAAAPVLFEQTLEVDLKLELAA